MLWFLYHFNQCYHNFLMGKIGRSLLWNSGKTCTFFLNHEKVCEIVLFGKLCRICVMSLPEYCQWLTVFPTPTPICPACCLDIVTFLSLGVACVISSCFFLGHFVLAGHCILLGRDIPALHFSWGKTHFKSSVSFCLLPPPLRQCLQYNGWPIRHQGTQ